VAPKRRSQKPAKQLGLIVFPKNGAVEKITEEWPRLSEGQELRVVEMFAVTLAEWHGRRLENIQPLPQTDHDAVAFEDGVRTEIQVTELVTRSVVRDYGAGAFIYTEGDLDAVLLNTILLKLDKYPPSQSRLMLLVYSVDPGATEFCEVTRNDPVTGEQELAVPKPLQIARTHLVEHGAGPFDEVWFAAPSPTWAQVSPVFPSSLFK
jgi:hypothetical protein